MIAVPHQFPLSVLDTVTQTVNYDDESDLSVPKPGFKYYFCDDGKLKCLVNHQKYYLFIYRVYLCILTFVDQCLHLSGTDFDIVGFCETHLHDDICKLNNLL